MPEETASALYQPTTEEVEIVVTQLKALDPKQEGVNARQMRAFYPRQDWNYIRGLLEGVRAAGLASHKTVVRPGAKVGIELYIWQ